MDACLLFYQAHRTALCQAAAEKRLGPLGFTLLDAAACAGPEGLRRQLASALKKARLLLVISETENGAPLCAKAVFAALRIPVNSLGEPSHVCTLNGGATRGYLLESRTQAVVLLTDIPEELDSMLFSAETRLALKFERELPTPPDPIDYEALVEHSFDHK